MSTMWGIFAGLRGAILKTTFLLPCYGFITGGLLALELSTVYIKWPKNPAPCRPQNVHCWAAYLNFYKSIPILLGVIGVGGSLHAYLYYLAAIYPFVGVTLICTSVPQAVLIMLFTVQLYQYVVNKKRTFAYGMPLFNSVMEALLEATEDELVPLVSISLGGFGVVAYVVYRIKLYFSA